MDAMDGIHLNEMLERVAGQLPRLTLSRGRVLWAPDGGRVFCELTPVEIKRRMLAMFGREAYVPHAHEAHGRFMALAQDDLFSFDMARYEVHDAMRCTETGRLFYPLVAGHFDVTNAAPGGPCDVLLLIGSEYNRSVIGTFKSSDAYLATYRHLRDRAPWHSWAYCFAGAAIYIFTTIETTVLINLIEEYVAGDLLEEAMTIIQE